jgi:4-amino-4-deoxy-L-arabinose transferase-like glycosyltransferase
VLAEGLASASRSQPFAAALAGLAGLALAWRVVLVFALPPYGYDALSYHLPNVISWLQVGRITTSPLNICCAYYPQNAEVLTTWPALLGGRAEYVDLVQIAAALIGAAAVAGIARVALIPASGALIAASLFVLTPILLAQSNTAYVDVTFTGEALAAFYLILRYLEADGRERLSLLGCAGAATALCVGTKPTGIEFGVVFALPLLVRAVARRQSTWREGGLAVALFGVPIAVLGISWYLHSWIVTGSPFHPMNVKLLGATVFEGTNHLGGPPPQLARHSVVLQPFFSWFSDLHFWTKAGYSYGEEVGGLGPVWSYFGAILVIVFAVHAWRRRRVVFWYFLVPLALFFAAQPDHWLSRYTLPLAAAGSIAVAWVITAPWRPSQLRLAFAGATLALAAGGAFIASKEIVPGSLGAKVIVRDILHGRRPVRGPYNPDYAPIVRLRHAVRIAIDLESVHTITSLAGIRFQNRLLALPLRGNLQAYVRAHRVDYVVTRKGSYYDRRAQHDGARFTLFGGRRVRTYRVDLTA